MSQFPCNWAIPEPGSQNPEDKFCVCCYCLLPREETGHGPLHVGCPGRSLSPLGIPVVFIWKWLPFNTESYEFWFSSPFHLWCWGYAQSLMHVKQVIYRWATLLAKILRDVSDSCIHFTQKAIAPKLLIIMLLVSTEYYRFRVERKLRT